MHFVRYLLIFCLSIVMVSCLIGGPQWSDNYHVKGVLSIPQSGVVEPFEAWYSKQWRKSRVDFYRGMVQTYQDHTYNEYGVNYKIFPYTDEVNLNIEACLSSVGTAEKPVNIQPILYPVEDVFKYEGQVERNGELVQKWTHFETFGYNDDISLDLTFYIKCVKRVFARPKCTPVHLQMIGGNAIFPSHVGNYYIDFDLYEPDVVTKEMVQIDFPVCHDISTLDMDASLTFNPLQEFLPGIVGLVKGKSLYDEIHAIHSLRFYNRKEKFKSLVNFQKNHDYVRSHNRKNSTYKLAVNNFAAFDKDQIFTYNKRLRDGYFPQLKKLTKAKKRKLLKSSLSVKTFRYTSSDLELLSRYGYYNLQQNGAMNPVQSQLNCGSCWAFATAAALEGAYFKKYNQRIKLSEQALIDCSWGYRNLGCDGGMEIFALDWIIKHEGLPISKEYGGYKANNGYCAKQNHSEVVRVKRYEAISPGDHRAIQIALLKYGPVLTAMQAGIKSVAFYSRGVYNNIDCESSSKYLDHAVVIVGFGYEDNKLYWIVRNSWSSAWGVSGLMYVAADNNICGLSTQPLVVYIE